MRFKKGKMAMAAVVFCVFAVGITYAAVSDTISFVENFETGKVGMTLQQLTVTENGETDAAPEIVEANKDISYIPRFTSTGENCYIRAKVTVKMDGETPQPLGVEHLYGLNGGWVQKGDYFYIKEPLEHGYQSDLFKGIHIPADWDAGSADGFEIEIAAEAIQSKNFDPDFDAELPWGAVLLEDVATGAVCYKKAESVKKVSQLKYSGNGGFECSTEDLFDEFDGMMAGDICRKSVEVQNRSGSKLRMYLAVSPGETELMEEMTLNIKCGEQVLYYGVMSEVCKDENFSLIDIEKGGTETLDFEMKLPAGAGNKYSESEDNLVWELKAEQLPDKVVQTDDVSRMAPYILAAVLAALAAAGLLFFRRKETE